MIHGMNHFTITAEDRAQTLDYYCGLLGLTEGHAPRPGLPRRLALCRRRRRRCCTSYWDRPMPDRAHGCHRPHGLQRQRRAEGREGAASTHAASSTTCASQAGAGTWQLFSHDPNGAKVELDFEASETL